ncbi:MAG: hydrolase [Bdellovibrionales bacterium]|nr:hydrolase [Bdellovibrionales bacterium]
MGSHKFAPSLLVTIILLSPSLLHRDPFSKWILWNVGQGQFLTLSKPKNCWHFDLGGERAPWPEILNECQYKENRISISHWDWDHLSLLNLIRQKIQNTCLDYGPPGPPPSPKKARILKRIPHCKTPHTEVSWTEIRWTGPPPKTSNGLSRVFYDRHSKLLIPGDSPQKQELSWSTQNRLVIAPTQFLILGHHGSQSSSSKTLLNHLPHLKLGLVSARKKRYGHPHRKISQRFQKLGIPLIQTEYWGHIIIPVPTSTAEGY